MCGLVRISVVFFNQSEILAFFRLSEIKIVAKFFIL